MTYHNQRQPNGRFAPKNPNSILPKPKAKSAPKQAKQDALFPAAIEAAPMVQPAPLKSIISDYINGKDAKPIVAEPKLINNIIFVIDRSGSIHEYGLTDHVKKFYGEQVSNFKNLAHQSRQNTNISLMTFNGDVSSEFGFKYIQNVPVDFSYTPAGGTALISACTKAIKALDDQEKVIRESHKGSQNELNISNLMIVITDGEENSSQRSDLNNFKSLIASVGSRSNFTMVFNCPFKGVAYLEGFGVPKLNIRPWETTLKGISEATTANVNSANVYFSARSAGATKSVDYFKVDMTKIDAKDLNKLPNEANYFIELTVEKEIEIKDFIDNAIAKSKTVASAIGNTYEAGKAYYQLTKEERIQPQKDIIIVDNMTKAVHSGAAARRLLGFSTNVDVKVSILNLSYYSIFVQSTSTNRKLVRGTKVYYRRLFC